MTLSSIYRYTLSPSWPVLEEAVSRSTGRWRRSSKSQDFPFLLCIARARIDLLSKVASTHQHTITHSLIYIYKLQTTGLGTCYIQGDHHGRHWRWINALSHVSLGKVYQLSYRGNSAGRSTYITQYKTKANFKPLCYGTVYTLTVHIFWRSFPHTQKYMGHYIYMEHLHMQDIQVPVHVAFY